MIEGMEGVKFSPVVVTKRWCFWCQFFSKIEFRQKIGKVTVRLVVHYKIGDGKRNDELHLDLTSFLKPRMRTLSSILSPCTKITQFGGSKVGFLSANGSINLLVMRRGPRHDTDHLLTLLRSDSVRSHGASPLCTVRRTNRSLVHSL